MKIKNGLLPIFLILVGSYTLEASAIGKSYEFTAEYGWSNWQVMTTHVVEGNNYSLYVPNPLTPIDNFTGANSTITGRFSYDTSAPIQFSGSSGSRDFTTYNAEAFSINLNSETGGNDIFTVNSPQTAINSFSDNSSAPFFQIFGNTINPLLTIARDPDSCTIDGLCGDSFDAELPLPQLRNDFPDIFNNISRVTVGISYSHQIEEQYQLDLSHLYVVSDELKSLNGTLPENLPSLANTTQVGIDLGFNLSVTDGGNAQLRNIETIDGSQSTSEQGDQIENFVSTLFAETDQITAIYELSELRELAIGTTSFNPILPDPEATPGEGFEFTFVPNEDDFTFIDPEVAVGYDYEILEGANFLAVLLPEGIGDNLYDLWLFDEAQGVFVDSGEDLIGGIAHMFESEGLESFRILGIEVDENLDPEDPTAFVTGLKFLTADEVSLSQTAITQTVVPVPPSIVLFLSGVVGLFLRNRNII